MFFASWILNSDSWILNLRVRSLTLQCLVPTA